MCLSVIERAESASLITEGSCFGVFRPVLNLQHTRFLLKFPLFFIPPPIPARFRPCSLPVTAPEWSRTASGPLPARTEPNPDSAGGSRHALIDEPQKRWYNPRRQALGSGNRWNGPASHRRRHALKEITLYLARHGESTANAEGIFASHRIDAPLSENGIRQARELTHWFKETPISAVYVSPLRRARQTAEIACAPFDGEFVVTDSLAEIDVGDLEGKPEKDPRSRTAYNRVLGLWERGFHDKGFAGGETLADAKGRLARLLRRIEDGGSDHVLLIGHCLLFMALIWLFCEDHGPTLEDGHMGRGRLTILRKTDGSFRLHAFDIAPGSHIPGT